MLLNIHIPTKGRGLNQSNQYVLQHLRIVPLRKSKHKLMSCTYFCHSRIVDA